MRHRRRRYSWGPAIEHIYKSNYGANPLQQSFVGLKGLLRSGCLNAFAKERPPWRPPPKNSGFIFGRSDYLLRRRRTPAKYRLRMPAN
jgi:hypothetical protein